MSDPNIERFPSPPRVPEDEPPAGTFMSTPETLANIFFDPGSVFESLRARPRFLVAGLIIIVISLAFTSLFFQRVGYENAMRASIEDGPNAGQTKPEDRARRFQIRLNPVVKTFYYISPVIAMIIATALGAALYLLGTMAMGQRISYRQALSIWAYSTLPPLLLVKLLSILLLFLKPVDEIDAGEFRGDIVNADLGLLVDAKASPMLASALGAIDLFTFYGLFLAALGLRYVARLSTGAAWGIVLIVWAAKIVLRLIWAIAIGSAIG
jgi:hypothetical protein